MDPKEMLKAQQEKAMVEELAKAAAKPAEGTASVDEIADMAASIAAAEEEKKMALADQAPEALVAAAANKVLFFSLEEVDYDKKWNIRAEYDARVLRTYQRLLMDKVVRNPLVVARIIGEPANYHRGVAGFLRYRALLMIKERHPEIWAEFFEGKVPFRVYIGDNGTGISETARHRLMLDHGTEEPLTQYEVFLAQEAYTKQGKTAAECCDLLAPLYYQLAKAAAKTTYDAEAKRIANGETVVRGVEKCRTMFALNKVFWRGRNQRFGEALAACPKVRDMYAQALQTGEPKLTDAEWKELFKATEAEVDTLLSARAKGETLAAKPTEGRVWSKKQLEAAKAVAKSTIFQTVYAAILGSEEAATRLPDLDNFCLEAEVKAAATE